MRYYRNTFLALLALFLAAIAIFIAATMFRSEKREALESVRNAAALAAENRRSSEAEQLACERRVKVPREFIKAWQSYAEAAAPVDLGNTMRAGLTALATQTGLTSESATVATDARSYAIAGHTIKVQQVSLNVIGESLPAILAWLGAVESRFAYARVESCALTAYASHSVQLSVTLLHPVENGTPRVSLPSSEKLVVQK